MDWRKQAQCRGEDPELFFPVSSAGSGMMQTEKAKSVCRRCPVREQCLEWALENGQYGVWGGLSEDERRGMRRRAGRKRATHR
ncbi:WhiB family transcriptional regulator, redox-sensing transcriptional regulator [Actinacidiphila yanglinensis]|uniref:Transcriptional regulator WhiB n=1 Tax=Actinacidiphila yanglinensis TaxID=310779 RepID=A0A1H6DPU0_9ACTN|nr:WhiB family transcriptional regulator [Actinacidiphila yanglinensis]SEG87319.1 WhiB family transcriptional regulator, redox-sensing transcriptional regulator [Actinacidiphila yanglinensis]